MKRRLADIAALAALAVLATLALKAQTPVRILDTLMDGQGRRINATLTISWGAFVASGGTTIPAGSTFASVTNGNLDISLVPNAASGIPYIVRFPSPVCQETWFIPVSGVSLGVVTVRQAGSTACVNAATGGGSGAVASVFSRTGAIVATNSDYAAFYAALVSGLVAPSQLGTGTASVSTFLSGASMYRALAASDIPTSLPAVNAGTASALAGNPVACPSGQYASDIAADGTLTCSTPAGSGLDPGSNGIVVRTGSGTAAARSIIGGSGINCVNGSGVAGDPTCSADTAVLATRQGQQTGLDTYCAPSSASTSAYVCALTPAIGSYTSGQRLAFRADVATGSTPTLDAGAGAKRIYASDGTSAPAFGIGDQDILIYDASLNAAAGGWRRMRGAAGGGGGTNPTANGFQDWTGAAWVARTLTAGTGVDITNGTGGGAPVFSLTCNPYDRAHVCLKDEFYETSSGSGAGPFGEMSWYDGSSVGSGSTFLSGYGAPMTNRPGVIWLRASGTLGNTRYLVAANGSAITTATGVGKLGASGTYAAWQAEWTIFSDDNSASFSAIQAGFSSAIPPGYRTGNSIAARWDARGSTCTSGTDSTSQWVLEVISSGSSTCVASGVSVAVVTSYTLRLASTTPGTVTLQVSTNGGAFSSPVSTSTNVPTASMVPSVIAVAATGGNNGSMFVDRFGFTGTGVSR